MLLVALTGSAEARQIAPAPAQVTFADCSLNEFGTAYICRNGLVIYVKGVPGAVEESGPAWQPPPGWVRVGILKADPNPWGACVTYQWVAPGNEPDYPPGTFDPLNNYPACTPASGAASQNPASFAALAWQVAKLPTPTPKIQPGRAIVGKDAFLETVGQLHFTHIESTPLGELRIEATGQYHVNWGDGGRSGPHRVEGQSWPSGQITHEYQDAGAYDVEVTETWTATWRLGADGGALPEGALRISAGRDRGE